MERASKLIRRLRLPGDTITTEEIACAAWPAAVGNKIAAHTRAARLVRSRLVVEVEDAIWQRQLFFLSRHILKNLENALGPGAVDDVEFRVVPRRREAARAVESRAGLVHDEAAAIEDPILRSIYRLSKKRAHA